MDPSLACYRHVSLNLDLFGFGSDPQTSLLQCLKEVLDNAYEATRQQLHPEISIRLRQSSDSLCLLDITDNGVGFPNLDFMAALTCLSSNRLTSETMQATSSFGRFGCGLSASLIYSMQSTGSTMRIISKQASSEIIRMAEVSLDPSTGQGTKHLLMQSQRNR